MNLDGISKEKILDQIEKLHNVEIPDNLLQQELVDNYSNFKKRRC